MTGGGRRWHAPELTGQQASVVALVLIAVIACLDVLTVENSLLVPLVLIAPFFVAAYGTPGQTLAVAAVATGASLLVALPEDMFGTDDHVAIVVRVAIAGAIAVWLADRRLRREEELAHTRPAAEVGHRLELALAAGRMGSWSWDMRTGRVEWDDACSALFGLERREFVGTFDAWEATLHPDDRDSVLGLVHAAVEDRGSFRFDHRCVWPDGSVHWIEGAGEVVVEDDEVVGATGVVVDIDARRRAAESLWTAGTRAATLLELARALATAADTEAVTQVILNGALPSVGARGGLSLVERPTGVLRHVGITGYPEGSLDHWQTIPLDARTPISDAAREERAVYIESAEHLTREYPHLARVIAATGDEAFVSLPLKLTSGDTMGVLMVAYPTERTFSPDDRTFLETLATMCSQALGRAQLTALQHGLEIASVLDNMLDAVAVDSVVRDEDGNIVDFRIEYVNAARAAAAHQTADQLVGRLLLEVAPNMKGSDLFDAYVSVVETGEPVRLSGVPYDQLVGGHDDADRVFEIQISKTRDQLLVAARDVTQRERVTASLRESEARLAEAQRIAHVGSWEWDAARGEVAWSAEMYRIYGLAPGNAFQSLDETLEHCTPECRGRVRDRMLAAVREGRAFTIEQDIVRADGEVRTTLVNAEPILDDEGRLASLRGTTQDVTESRAAQEALFLAAAELEREREVVEALQRAILPHELPEVDGLELSAHYLPASIDVEIGGDWYDAFVLADGRICLAVGDVAGHGVQSAATMGQLRNAFRAYAYAGFGPSQTLAQLDHLLHSAAESDWSCATVLFVEYTPATRHLRWARAGHPHPVLHRDSAKELVGAGGPPVGAGVPDYDESDVTLEPGDVLFLYTDGLVERPGEVLDVGIGRLLAAVDALGVDDDFSLYATRVCTEVLEDRPRRDDVCVLALRVTG